ncbi:HAMP domain-containing sensor histidine kinase [Pelagibius sp. 7325]|uniref:sensor histidine kinase n=1 Tax=Pelagibius sp. 7325 TaxID=3131994 RepID=UPI0030EBE59A
MGGDQQPADRPGPAVAVDPVEIDAAMIRGLYHRVRPLIIANFGALILLTFALWDQAPRLPLTLWAAGLASWTMLRFVLAKIYLRRERPLSETWRWTLAFACGSTVAGCLWGSSVVFVGDLASDNAKLVTAFLMAALSAAAIAGYTNSLLAFAGFITPALLPYAYRLINLSGSPSLVVALFVMFWALLLWVMARHLNDGFRESLALSFRNRNLAEQWRFQRDRAEEASQAKSRFLGHMSHELRTPLNAVIGYADMMARKMLGPLGHDAYEGYARDIRDSGRHMLAMVDGILDLSAAESGRLEVALRPTEIGVIVTSAAALAEEIARTKDVTVEAAIAEDLPLVNGNADRLLQVVMILVDNAVKYSAPGRRITIAANEEDAAPGDATEEGGGWITLTVGDEGPGMDAGLVAAVQRPFVQAEGENHLVRSADSRAPDGRTSPRLSLPLAKLLVEAHGGTLTIDSAPGHGTRVTLRLPALAPVPARAAAVQAAE